MLESLVILIRITSSVVGVKEIGELLFKLEIIGRTSALELCKRRPLCGSKGNFLWTRSSKLTVFIGNADWFHASVAVMCNLTFGAMWSFAMRILANDPA